MTEFHPTQLHNGSDHTKNPSYGSTHLRESKTGKKTTEELLQNAAPTSTTANGGDITNAEFYSVEDAVESMGFGWFQGKMLIICGIMSAADAMEMLLLSVLGPALRCEWQLSSSQVAIITTIVFTGMFVGAPCWGAISDKYGRWNVFVISLCMIFYFGFLCAFSPNYVWVVLLRGLVGFSIGGAASSFTLLSEYLPQKYRAKVLIAYQLAWAIGSTFEIILAYLVIPVLGWRYLVAFSSIPLLIFVLFTRFLPESARFLIASGQVQAAAKILNKMAKENKKPMLKGKPIVSSGDEKNRGDFLALFHKNYRFTSCILFVLWFGIAFLYYGIILVSTEIFRFHSTCYQVQEVKISHNATGNVVDDSCCLNLSNQDYTAMLVSSFGEFVIIPLNMFMIDWLGRRWTLSINYALAGIFFGLTYFCVPPSATTAFLFMIRAHATGIFNTIYIYTSEVYPTTARSVGLGICSSMARLGSMSTPFVAQVIMPDVSVLFAFCIYTGVSVVCAILSAVLPIETKGRPMPQSVEQQVNPASAASATYNSSSQAASINYDQLK